MTYVKPLLPYEPFMASIEAGSDKYLIIQDLVESYNLTLSSAKIPVESVQSLPLKQYMINMDFMC